MSDWKVIGQIGTIVKKEKHWLVDIAENKYNDVTNEKENTIWFKCISKFEPRIQVGDTVIAVGVFAPSKNDNFPYAMMMSNVGKIIKKE